MIKNSLIAVLALIVFGCTIDTNRVPAPFIPGNIKYIENGELVQVSSHDTTEGNNDRINIQAGDSAVIFNRQGPGVIARIWVTVDSRDPHFLRRILLRMYWDGEENPSVEVPLGDFFGSGFEYRHHISEYTGMSSGGYYSYFPMPFHEDARIEVVNQTGQEVYAFYYQVDYYRMETLLPVNTPTFHVRWKRDIRTTGNQNFTALEAEGAGYYVGTHFHGQSYSGGLGYLEGDEMFYVDGESEPSIYGTGLEDYFTSGWYFQQGEYSAPYHGLVVKDDQTGRISAYRYHIPDAIPFDDSIRATFEHGHGNESSVDFSTTAFWYQVEPHKAQEPIKPAGLRIPLQRPVPNGSVEAETLHATGDLEMNTVDMSDFGADWSGRHQLEIRGGTGDHFEINIPGRKEEAYTMWVYLTKGPDYGNLRISHQGGSKIFEGYSEQVRPADAVSFQEVQPLNGKINIRFDVTGKNAESSGFKAGIDAIKLEPERDFITDWNLIGPFPNPRTPDGRRVGIDSVYTPENEIDLNATYTGAGGQDISWQAYRGLRAGYGMNMNGLFEPDELVVSYALTYIYSPEEQLVPLFLGTDDGSKVFLNDEQLYRFLEVRVAAPDQDTVQLDLQPGWNKLLLKLENNFGGYAFYARVIDQKGNLVISADKTSE